SELGRKPSSAIARCTCSALAGATPAVLLTTRETAAGLPPARSATSRMLGGFRFDWSAIGGQRSLKPVSEPGTLKPVSTTAVCRRRVLGTRRVHAKDDVHT